MLVMETEDRCTLCDSESGGEGESEGTMALLSSVANRCASIIVITMITESCYKWNNLIHKYNSGS